MNEKALEAAKAELEPRRLEMTSVQYLDALLAAYKRLEHPLEEPATQLAPHSGRFMTKRIERTFPAPKEIEEFYRAARDAAREAVRPFVEDPNYTAGWFQIYNIKGVTEFLDDCATRVRKSGVEGPLHSELRSCGERFSLLGVVYWWETTREKTACI